MLIYIYKPSSWQVCRCACIDLPLLAVLIWRYSSVSTLSHKSWQIPASLILQSLHKQLERIKLWRHNRTVLVIHNSFLFPLLNSRDQLGSINVSLLEDILFFNSSSSIQESQIQPLSAYDALTIILSIPKHISFSCGKELRKRQRENKIFIYTSQYFFYCLDRTV